MIRSGLKRIRSVTNAIFDAVLPEKKQKVEPESKSKWMSYTEILEALARLDNIPPTFTTLGLPVYSSNEDSPLFELAPLILQRATYGAEDPDDNMILEWLTPRITLGEWKVSNSEYLEAVYRDNMTLQTHTDSKAVKHEFDFSKMGVVVDFQQKAMATFKQAGLAADLIRFIPLPNYIDDNAFYITLSKRLMISIQKYLWPMFCESNQMDMDTGGLGMQLVFDYKRLAQQDVVNHFFDYCTKWIHDRLERARTAVTSIWLHSFPDITVAGRCEKCRWTDHVGGIFAPPFPVTFRGQYKVWDGSLLCKEHDLPSKPPQDHKGLDLELKCMARTCKCCATACLDNFQPSTTFPAVIRDVIVSYLSVIDTAASDGVDYSAIGSRYSSSLYRLPGISTLLWFEFCNAI